MKSVKQNSWIVRGQVFIAFTTLDFIAVSHSVGAIVIYRKTNHRISELPCSLTVTWLLTSPMLSLLSVHGQEVEKKSISDNCLVEWLTPLGTVRVATNFIFIFHIISLGWKTEKICFIYNRRHLWRYPRASLSTTLNVNMSPHTAIGHNISVGQKGRWISLRISNFSRLKSELQLMASCRPILGYLAAICP